MRISDAASQQITQLLSQIKKGEVSVGDIFAGRIISNENGHLLLQLLDGSKISAQTVTDLKYNIGDVLNLEIIEEKQGLIYVRQTDKNITQASLIKNSETEASLLKSLGLPIDSKHMEIMKAVQEMGVEPSHDIIEKALQLMSEGKVRDPKQAVFLVYNNMADKPPYFPVLKNLVGGVFNFQDEWTSTTQNINQLDDKTIMQIAESFLINDALRDLNVGEEISQLEKYYMSFQSNTDANALAEPVTNTGIKSVLVNNMQSLLSSDEIINLQNLLSSDDITDLKSLLSSGGITNLQDLLRLDDNTGMQSIHNENSENLIFKNIPDTVASMGDMSSNNALNSFISSDLKSTLDALIERFFPRLIPTEKALQDDAVRILKNLILRVMEKLPDERLPDDEAKKIINGSLTKLIEKAPSESPEVKLPKLDEWAEDTENRLNIIKEALIASTGSDKERVQEQVRELETALRFFQDIISYEAYAQIPLLLKDNTTGGEIYIMKRKNKNGKLNPDEFSVFLSLTTLNVGTLDTFINVRNKNVMLRIMAEDEKYFGLLQEEYSSLYNDLKEKGYNLYEVKCLLRDEGVHLINANRKASDFVYTQNKKIDMRI